MRLYEYAGNLHIHTTYSDGAALHADIARAAAQAGLHFVIVTDHNIWVDGCEGYYDKILLLVGEEIHDVRRRPQANHLLIYNANSELAPLASDPQQLINEVNQRGGFSYIAHPHEYGSPIGPGLEAIRWENWEVTGYTGWEIWNYMSEFKSLLRSKLSVLYYAYFPRRGIRGPFRATLRHWDQMLAQGWRIAAIGGSDAHGKEYSWGPLRRVLFPYDYLFRCINTHIVTPRPLTGNLETDKKLIYDALRHGHTWVGYDLLGTTEGFRFYARSFTNEATVGDELMRAGATKFEVQTPQNGDIRLLVNGQIVARARGQTLQHISADPGAYRVEVYRGGKGWIFSSPIYVI